jgi:hypothetical protein
MTTVDYQPLPDLPPAAAAAALGGGDEPPPWVYSSLLEWMEGWFLPVAWRYDHRHRHWCVEWWRHRYAIERLRALWVSWETMYADPESISAWWVYHFDAHWAALTSEAGPFRDCSKEHTDSAHPLPHTDPPDGWQLPVVAD